MRPSSIHNVRLATILLFVAILLFPASLPADVTATSEVFPLMHPDERTMQEWIRAYDEARRTAPADVMPAASLTRGSVDLLPHMVHIPSERNQGACGNCWVWAGTGCMEIALSVQEDVRDRLSVQVVNSCRGVLGKACCQGGWLSEFTAFYEATGRALPWSNMNAYWQDSDGRCNVPCGEIATEPHYNVAYIEALTIPTNTRQGVSHRAQAINNVKAELNSGKGVWFVFFAPPEGWQRFRAFWSGQPEATAIRMDDICAGTPSGGGHAVLCVGYDDTDPNDGYWIMLNSWGTAGGRRPNGLFRIKMDMDYDTVCAGLPAFYWQTLDVSFRLPPVVATLEASQVTSEAACVVGRLDDSDMLADVRFAYGTTSGGPYNHVTSWQPGFAAGQKFEAMLSGLLPGMPYYYRAQASNSGGTSSGEEESFFTGPLPPSNFRAQAMGESGVELTWQPGSGAAATVVRGQQGDFPDGPDDGDLVYEGAGRSEVHSGLHAGNAYFYRAWSLSYDPESAAVRSQESATDCAHTIGAGIWMVGDVNLDGRVNIIDAMCVAQHVVGLRELDAIPLLCADTTGDGAVNIIDAMHIAQFSVDPAGSAGILFKQLWESPQHDGMLNPLAPCGVCACH